MWDVPHNLLLGCQNKKVNTPQDEDIGCEALSGNDAFGELGSKPGSAFVVTVFGSTKLKIPLKLMARSIVTEGKL